MNINNPTFFAVLATLSTVIPLLAGIFVIYFLISVMKFMKKKIKLDEQRIEQTNQFLELYKSTKDIN